jgi:LPS-assembly protein
MSKIGFSIHYVFILILGITLGMGMLSGSSDKIEIKAKNVESFEGVITATNNVVVRYDGMLIKAKKARYHQETKMLILDGDIETIGYNGTKEHAQHMEINTETKDVNFGELFLVNENDVWVLSDEVQKTKDEYTLNTSILSSCDISDPLWTMRFSDSTYDTNENYIKVYNAKVYLWDVPIFYTPYLAFSTNRQRSSGLLFPLFGYTETEGFIYEQPVFWAISENMDLEINPQIRTNRSVGIYSTLRFVDSNHSKGALRVGYFKDQQSYTDEYNLPNTSHYGIELNYESTEVFKKYLPSDYTDGLYVNTTYLNDIDYLYLQKRHLEHFGLSPIQESRVNYFATNEDYYFGVNAKYFIDTRVGVDDEKTLQVLPSIQMHQYLTSFIFDNLTYSADFKINNFDRKSGATMQQAEMRIPIEFSTSFFDDFLNLSLGEELYYSKHFFGNGDFVHDDYQYSSNVHSAKLSTDLIKKYDNFTHVLQPSIGYIKPGGESESPLEFSLLDDEQKALFKVGLPEEGYTMSLSQYFYDDAMTLKFFQRLSQRYYTDRAFKLADTTNEMQYNWEKYSIYNNLIYSHEFDDIRESSSHLSISQDYYRLNLGHTYKQLLTEEEKAILLNDMTFDFSYTYDQQLSFGVGFTYNIEDAESRQWKVGGTYYRDCWSMVASIRQDIRPTSVGAISENTFYIQLNFTPFGSIGTDTLQ